MSVRLAALQVAAVERLAHIARCLFGHILFYKKAFEDPPDLILLTFQFATKALYQTLKRKLEPLSEDGKHGIVLGYHYPHVYISRTFVVGVAKKENYPLID